MLSDDCLETSIKIAERVVDGSVKQWLKLRDSQESCRAAFRG